MIGWIILNQVISALTMMTKIAEISTKIEITTAFLFLTYIKHNIDNTIVKELLLLNKYWKRKLNNLPMAHFSWYFLGMQNSKWRCYGQIWSFYSSSTTNMTNIKIKWLVEAKDVKIVIYQPTEYQLADCTGNLWSRQCRSLSTDKCGLCFLELDIKAKCVSVKIMIE